MNYEQLRLKKGNNRMFAVDERENKVSSIQSLAKLTEHFVFLIFPIAGSCNLVADE